LFFYHIRVNKGVIWGGLEGLYRLPRIYDFNFPPINRIFETLLLLCKTIRYLDLGVELPITETPSPNNLLK